jgi:tetratricopeptide (TPR) repeat protein
MMEALRTSIRCAGACALVLVSFSASALAQGPAYISDIRKPQPPGGSFESNVGVETVTIILARDKQARRGFRDFSLDYRDEIRIRRTTPPTISKLIVSFRDNNRERVDLAEGAVYQIEDGGAINVEEGIIGWIVGRFRTTTKHLQAIARGTQYGFLIEGEKTILFVWEGSVEVSNRSGVPRTVTVAAKQLTEAIGAAQPSAPRVPRFDEIKDLVLFGLEVDPDVRIRIRDERSQLQLHQDLVRAEFETAARPTDVGPLVNLGNLNLLLGRYDQALDFFNQAEKFSPRSGDIYNGRGIIFTMRRNSDALAEFTTALTRDRASRFYNNLGVYYLDRQQWGKAIDELRSAVRRDRYNDIAYNALGVALLQSGQTGAPLSESEAALQRAVTIKEHPVALNNLGTVSLLQGKTDDAQVKYKRAAQLDPTDAAVANNLGVAFLKQARFEEAIGQFLTAVQAVADDPTAYCNLGLIHHAKPELRASIRQRVQALPPPRAALASVRQAFLNFLDEVEMLPPERFEQACDKFKAALPARR